VFFGPSISFGHSKNGKKQADAGDDFSHIFSPQKKRKIKKRISQSSRRNGQLDLPIWFSVSGFWP